MRKGTPRGEPFLMRILRVELSRRPVRPPMAAKRYGLR